MLRNVLAHNDDRNPIFKGDTTALIFALKGRHGYRDNGNPQGTGDSKVNVTINLPAAQPSVEAYVAALNVEGDR